MTTSKLLTTFSLSSSNWRNYLHLCKPKVVALLLITAFVAMQLAVNTLEQLFAWQTMLTIMLALTGIGLGASSAAVINHLVDIKIDSKMQRTQQRPMVKGSISIGNAVLFAVVLATASMGILITYINLTTALLTLSGLIGYAFIYSLYLKHRTPQNIVIGGLSGALPPLLGWTSITNEINLNAMILLLVIFLWTPAHFWALAIDRIEDYKKAKVPMLPVIKGIPHTKNCIISYALLTILVSCLPFVVELSGIFYLICALGLGAWYLSHCLKLKYNANEQTAKQCFFASINYLFALFSALLIDHYYLLITS